MVPLPSRAEFQAHVANQVSFAGRFIEHHRAIQFRLRRKRAQIVFLVKLPDFGAARFPVGRFPHRPTVQKFQRIGQAVHARQRIEIRRQFAGLGEPLLELRRRRQNLLQFLQVLAPLFRCSLTMPAGSELRSAPRTDQCSIVQFFAVRHDRYAITSVMQCTISECLLVCDSSGSSCLSLLGCGPKDHPAAATAELKFTIPNTRGGTEDLMLDRFLFDGSRSGSEDAASARRYRRAFTKSRRKPRPSANGSSPSGT